MSGINQQLDLDNFQLEAFIMWNIWIDRNEHAFNNATRVTPSELARERAIREVRVTRELTHVLYRIYGILQSS